MSWQLVLLTGSRWGLAGGCDQSEPYRACQYPGTRQRGALVAVVHLSR